MVCDVYFKDIIYNFFNFYHCKFLNYTVIYIFFFNFFFILILKIKLIEPQLPEKFDQDGEIQPGTEID